MFTAVVKPWHILNLVESGRALSFNRMPNTTEDPFLAVEDLYSRYGLFQGSVRLSVSKDLYNISMPKTPLILEKELVYVGKSSMNLHTNVLLPSRSLTLASCEVQSVLVDRVTRRPTPHADWWRKKFGRYTTPSRQLKVSVQKEPLEEVLGVDGSQNGKSASQQPVTGGVTAVKGRGPQDLPVSDSVTSLDLIVCDSDVDSYGHANWAVYLKYCLDALIMGTSLESSKQLKSRAVKLAEVAYIGEGSVGQRIRVNFWKDKTLPQSVHFRIVGLESKQLITYAFLQFYSLDDVELSISKL